MLSYSLCFLVNKVEYVPCTEDVQGQGLVQREE